MFLLTSLCILHDNESVLFRYVSNTRPFCNPAEKRRETKRTLSPSVIIHFQMKSKMAATANRQRGGVLTLSLVSCKGSGEKG